jgi:hypothetical protein
MGTVACRKLTGKHFKPHVAQKFKGKGPICQVYSTKMSYNRLNLQKIIYQKFVPAVKVNAAACVGIRRWRFGGECLTRNRQTDIFRRLQKDTPCIQ